jgi:hypothetical protein
MREKGKAISYFAGRVFKDLNYSRDSIALWVKV